MGSPCQHCKSRSPVCHDRCEEYIEWHEALLDAKRELRKVEEAVDYLIELALKLKKKRRLPKK